MNNTPSLHRYLYGNANPTFYIDLNGKLAEAGHKKTVTIAASEKGYNFSAGDITTLGFFAQVTDEADELDAIELTKNWWFCCEENNRLAKRRLPALHALMDDPQSNIWSPYLNGEGALAEIEVNRTVRAIVSIKDNKKAVGVLLHRLGDLFSHRQINDLSRLYPINLGHGGDGTDPDVIQGARSNLYDEYVQTMISVLALVKGNVSKEDFKVISRNILAKTDRIKNIPTTFDIQSTTFEMFGVEGKTASLTRNKSNSRLQKESNDMANEILLSVNQKRRDEGKRPINLSYKAELQNINHYFGSDITIQDVLDFAYNSVGKNSDTAWQIMFSEDDVNTAVEDAISALEAIPALTVDEAINANKALLFRESKDNKNEFQK